jgi:hypothetical protein
MPGLQVIKTSDKLIADRLIASGARLALDKDNIKFFEASDNQIENMSDSDKKTVVFTKHEELYAEMKKANDKK